MEEKNNSPIIIKRIKKIKKGHHGGAWKIAYADFVTAMMAFFLIMWILSMLNKSQLRSVADYFKDPKKYGMVEEGSRVNKEFVADNFLEKGVEKGAWKDVNKEKEKEKEKKKEDSKLKMDSKAEATKLPATVDPIQQLKELKKELEESLEKNPTLQQFKNNLNFVITADGLKIVLKDLENKPMFSRGKTDFEKYANTILAWLTEHLNTYPNQLTIIGHTDSVKFKGDAYTNWELSADRANSTRRVLIKNGMSANKILRVIGEADQTQLDTTNGENPSNRRIDIIVLTDEAAKRLQASSNLDAGASHKNSDPAKSSPAKSTNAPIPVNQPVSAGSAASISSVNKPAHSAPAVTDTKSKTPVTPVNNAGSTQTTPINTAQPAVPKNNNTAQTTEAVNAGAKPAPVTNEQTKTPALNAQQAGQMSLQNNIPAHILPENNQAADLLLKMSPRPGAQ